MTTAQKVRQIAIAFLLAVILAACLAIWSTVYAADEDEVWIPNPSICDLLEPYSYWWFFAGCHLR